MMAAPQAYTTAPAPAAGAPTQKVMSIWWPMSFLIAWVVLSAIGGGVFGSADASYASYSSFASFRGGRGGGGGGGGGGDSIWGGIACLVIGSICGIVFWVLLIIWLVQRSRSRRPQVVYAAASNNLAPAGGGAYYYPQAYHPGGLAPQQPQYPAQQVYYMPHASMAPAPGVVGGANHKAEGKACASCGTVAATPYCPQCGAQIS